MSCKGPALASPRASEGDGRERAGCLFEDKLLTDDEGRKWARMKLTCIVGNHNKNPCEPMAECAREKCVESDTTQAAYYERRERRERRRAAVDKNGRLVSNPSRQEANEDDNRSERRGESGKVDEKADEHRRCLCSADGDKGPGLAS